MQFSLTLKASDTLNGTEPVIFINTPVFTCYFTPLKPSFIPTCRILIFWHPSWMLKVPFGFKSLPHKSLHSMGLEITHRVHVSLVRFSRKTAIIFGYFRTPVNMATVTKLMWNRYRVWSAVPRTKKIKVLWSAEQIAVKTFWTHSLLSV